MYVESSRRLPLLSRFNLHGGKAALEDFPLCGSGVMSQTQPGLSELEYLEAADLNVDHHVVIAIGGYHHYNGWPPMPQICLIAVDPAIDQPQVVFQIFNQVTIMPKAECKS